MSISRELYPSEDDLPYEEELLRNPFSLKLWWRYLVARREAPFKKRFVIYERALKALPGSYKLWHAYLTERLDVVRNLNSGLWQEASQRLAEVLNDDQFYSLKGKTKHTLWLELCDLLTRHANEVSGLNVDAIIRGGIRKYADEVGGLWTSLADYYIRRGLFHKARDVFEEGMATVITVRDFSVIFDAYAEFEQGLADHKMENMDEQEVAADGPEQNGLEVDIRLDINSKFSGFWLNDDKDVDLMLARFDNLMERRPELANSVLLRQNPHNVEQWHRRVKLFDGNPRKQILTYTEAVRTVDPMKAVGKPHTLWVAFAKLYENHNDLVNARVIFDKAVQVNYKTVDHLASVWCEWAEMEIRHKNFKDALELLRRATAEPSVEVKQRVAADGNEPVQIKLHKSLRLWALYLDLEEGLGTLESTRAVYERILDLRIATPQIIINYACLLEEKKYFEDAFKVYERGVKIFKYPHVKDIWVTYLSKFVKRYGKTQLERARELFEHAIKMTPADSVKPLYLQYAKLEEDYGLAKRAMHVYDDAIKAVPSNERLEMYEIYIARATEIFGVPKTREIYEQAIEFGLREKDVKTKCMRYAELEKNLGEIDRARGIYEYASQFADPRSDQVFWSKWHDFEVLHEYVMQKDAKDKLKEAGLPEDEMAALEKVGFVSAGVHTQTDGGLKLNTNLEDIELPEESDSEEDDNDKVEIAQKEVPKEVFGGLVRKRDEMENGESLLGALQRLKRLKRESGKPQIAC
ncbi:Pre-mRNA-splicing factor SYF1 [Linum grandiflorum]